MDTAHQRYCLRRVCGEGGGRGGRRVGFEIVDILRIRFTFRLGCWSLKPYPRLAAPLPPLFYFYFLYFATMYLSLLLSTHPFPLYLMPYMYFSLLFSVFFLV
ncbi:hypothetical protein F4775DRAFT_565441 [Biscogniauxia sp. FL1348]|nr:hypothetical protein F4775DRAFT_565441 [Biscogniauxia sp. FL1348]